MNLNYKYNDKIASEGSFSVPSLGYFSSSLYFWLTLTFTLVLYFSFDPSVLFHFFFYFCSTQAPPPPHTPPYTDDSTASIFDKSKRETVGEKGKKFQTKITHSLIKLTRDSIKASLSKQEWYFIKWQCAIRWLHQATHLQTRGLHQPGKRDTCCHFQETSVETHFIKSAEKLRGLNIRMLIYFFTLHPLVFGRKSCCPAFSPFISNKSKLKDFWYKLCYIAIRTSATKILPHQTRKKQPKACIDALAHAAETDFYCNEYACFVTVSNVWAQWFCFHDSWFRKI